MQVFEKGLSAYCVLFIASGYLVCAYMINFTQETETVSTIEQVN